MTIQKLLLKCSLLLKIFIMLIEHDKLADL